MAGGNEAAERIGSVASAITPVQRQLGCSQPASRPPAKSAGRRVDGGGDAGDSATRLFKAALLVNPLDPPRLGDPRPGTPWLRTLLQRWGPGRAGRPSRAHRPPERSGNSARPRSPALWPGGGRRGRTAHRAHPARRYRRGAAAERSIVRHLRRSATASRRRSERVSAASHAARVTITPPARPTRVRRAPEVDFTCTGDPRINRSAWSETVARQARASNRKASSARSIAAAYRGSADAGAARAMR